MIIAMVSESLQPAAPVPVVANSQPELLAAAPSGFFFVYRSTLLLLWTTVPTREDVVCLRSVVGRLAERKPGPLAVLQLLAPDSPMPSADVRTGLTEVWQPLETDLAAMSLVLNGNGFWASAARAVINCMVIAARRTVPVRIHGTLDEALEWLPPLLSQSGGPVLSPAVLRNAVLAAEEMTCLLPPGGGATPGFRA